MKKLLLVALLMLALVITAVACNNEPADTTGETTATQTPATAEPDDSTAAPETPTEAPEVPTEAPEVPTEAPDTQAPEVPTDAPVTQAPVVTTEPVTEAPVDPADPVHMIDAAALAGATGTNAATVELNEAGYASFTATGGDPWVLIAGNIGAMPEYMAISYRTNTTQTGEFFIGNGAGPEGGKSFMYSYNANSEWNLLIFHLPTVAPYMTDNTVGHIRFDFYTGGAEDGAFMDVEYVAFFNTAEYAEAYHFEKHPAFVEKEEAGMKGHSFDTFYVNGAMYFPEDGGASDKLDAIDNTVIFGIDEAHDSMLLRGWIGFEQAIEAFGYYIDNPYTQTFGEFKTATEDAVIGIAGEHATRFEILVPLAELERGTHTVGFVVKLADGTVARLRTEITVVIPTNYENLTVPQDQWVITGHNTNLNDSSNPMVAAGGVESGALLHQGSIYLGELDLSKYSKVVVMWGCDNSGVTQGHYDANANNRIMLLNAVMDGVMSPAEETIIAGGTYELGGWAVQAFEIDLTNVSYNGPVYVAIDALPGTFALFASVEFIGAEITDEPTSIAVDGDFADWADKAVTEIPVSKFIAWTGSAPEAFNLKTSFSSDGEYLYVYLNPGENSGVTMYQICLITDNTVATDAAQAWYNVTFADGAASIAGVSGACKGEAKVFMTGTEVEAAIPIAAIYGEGFALPVETRILLVAQINGGTHMGTFHDGKNPNDDGWADRTGDGCPLALNADGTYTIDLPSEDEPEAPVVENVVIDLSTIEGYRAENNYGYDGPILNIGYDNVFLVGEFDLNQYSQIIIEYSYDGDTVVENKPVEQNWTECGRAPIIGFTALNKSFGYANVTNQDAIDNGIYVDMPHTPGNWSAATRTATIEVPENIGYSGPCYISAYNPWFREIAIVSITLVPRA